MTRHAFAALAAVLTLTVPRLPAQAADSASLVLEVDPAVLPPEPLRDALQAEFGFPIALASEAGVAGSRLELRALAPGRAVITLIDGTGRHVGRELALSDRDDPEAVETAALIAVNLLRNEAQELVAALAARAAGAPSAPPVPAPVPVVPESSPGACGRRVTAPIGLDFVPGVGSSSTRAGRSAVRGASLNVIGGISGGLRGASLAGVLAIERGAACGLQIAGVGNLVLGPSAGLQVAPLNLVHGALTGASLGVVQLATKDLRGAQLGVVEIAAGSVRGAQLGVVQVAARGVSGVQLGVANVSARELNGVQAGVANVTARDVRGLQLGVVNVSGGDVEGVQLGVINVARRSRASIGLLSIVRKGRTAVDVWANESGYVMGGLVHGGEVVHGLYYVGMRAKGEAERAVVALGFGARTYAGGAWRIDVDALAQSVIVAEGDPPTTLVAALRVPVTFVFRRGLGVMVAPSYQVLISDDPEEGGKDWFAESVFRDGRTRVVGSPGIAAGLRLELPRR